MENISVYVGFTITVFTGFFAIMNPIANLPAYVALVQGADKDERKQMRKKAVTVAFFIVLSFIVLGKIIFSLFGLSIPAFKITGGILIFLAGFDMVRSKDPGRLDKEDMQKLKFDQSVAISPLAIPLMAGPGSIVTAMTFVSGKDLISTGIVIVMFAFICLLHYFIFQMSSAIVKRLGQSVITVIGRIMGLIIAVIGTGMVLEGIKIAFKIIH